MASLLAFRPGRDFFSMSSIATHNRKAINPFVYKPPPRQATAIANIIRQQTFSSKDSYPRPSPVVSLLKRIPKNIDRHTMLLDFYNVNHLRGRSRRRMVKKLKLKLRDQLAQAPIANEVLDKVEAEVLSNALVDGPVSVEKKRQIVQDQIRSYVNETDSSHSSDETSSEQSGSPIHDAKTKRKRGVDDDVVDKAPRSKKVRKAEDASLKKRKLADNDSADSASPEGVRSPKRQKKAAAPPAKVATAAYRTRVRKEELPKAFQGLYNETPPVYKVDNAWREFPTSILVGKTTGSRNPSNYCYFNTALQLLAHIPALVQYLVYYHTQTNCAIARKEGVCACCEVREWVLRSYEDQRDGFYVLKRLGSILDKRFHVHPKKYHEQQDSNDAMLSILQKAIAQLKAEQEDPKEATPIEEIFSFKNRSTITCKACKHRSVEDTDTLLHIMDIPQGRSELPLMAAYHPSTTDTVSGYKCSNCHRNVEITKRTEIATLPPYLLVLATRNVAFIPTSRGRRGVESNPRRVVVPPSGPTTFTTSAGRGEVYKLGGVAIHQGNSHHNGHWIDMGKLPNGQWATHSDSRVSASRTFKFPTKGSIGVVFGFARV